MLLTGFLHDLLTTGCLTLTSQPDSFEAADLHAAEDLLRSYHAEDAKEMPHTAPVFNAPAALWSAAYLYDTVKLALVRELDETVVHEQLQDFSGDMTPEAIYSADLTFRHLPDLLRLAKGLAPGDALVGRLQAQPGSGRFHPWAPSSRTTSPSSLSSRTLPCGKRTSTALSGCRTGRAPARRIWPR